MVEQDKPINPMENTSLFSNYLKENVGMAQEEITRLQPEIKSKHVPKSTFLLEAGNVCTQTFFVEKGLLRMYSSDKNGKEHIIQFAPENWFVGDRSSVYFNKASVFFIEAVEDSQIVVLQPDFTCQAAAVSAIYSKYNDTLLHKHAHFMQRRINLLLGATAEERYLDFIKLYPDLLLRVPQWMVASYLGITPESLSRVRKELARKNFQTK